MGPYIKRCIIMLACVLILLGSITGCEKVDSTLRIIVEEEDDSFSTSGFRCQLDAWIAEFEATHEGVTIILEELPLDSESRNPTLKRLYSEYMAGRGPDIILLPNAYSDQAKIFGQKFLFDDLNLAMRNGVFLDISKYYDRDEELTVSELQKVVMDAGVVDGARYILPLRYDIPVFYVDREAFAETGLNPAVFESNLMDMMKAVAEMPDDRTACNFRMHWIQPQFTFNLLSELIDYDTGKVLFSEQELEQFLQAYQAYWVRILGSAQNGALSHRPEFFEYLNYGTFWADTGNFMFVGSLQQAMENAVISNIKKIELDMYPIRSTNGTVVADVTFYGAISSGCRNPDLAYEFLRAFLTEDFQWERNISNNRGPWKLAAPGWPVRTKNSKDALEESIWRISEIHFNFYRHKISKESLIDAQLPILDVPIDEARLSVSLEQDFWKMLSSLYCRDTNQASNEDINQLAKEWIKKLQRHIDEG